MIAQGLQDYHEEIEILTRLLDSRIENVQLLAGGRNSRVVVFSAAQNKYVAKFYFRDHQDSRDRFGSERQALEFFRLIGITCVPKIIREDQLSRCIVLEYVEGARHHSEISLSDITQLTDFIIQLAQAKNHETARFLPIASEAVFSFSELQNNLLHRIELLKSATDTFSGLAYQQCKNFLNGHFQDFYSSHLFSAPPDTAALLPQECRTLSPSDLGFHNAILKADGHWIFQDFEYFGWDDPAKLLIDVLLHPAMDLSNECKNAFLNSSLAHFEKNDKSLRSRVLTLYPFFGLKWCCILLNEFLPRAAERRRFAAGRHTPQDEESLLFTQLEKAKSMLEKTRLTHKTLGENYDL